MNDEYYDNLHMADIKYQLSKIDENAKHMTRKKREMSFEEGTVAENILQDLRRSKQATAG